MSDQTFDAKEAAKRLGVTPQTVRQWAKDGVIPHTRLPVAGVRNRYRFRQSDIEAFLNQHHHAPAELPKLPQVSADVSDIPIALKILGRSA